MARISRCIATASASLLLIVPAVLSFASDDPSADTGASKIRIVRLSEVKGAVKLDRNINRGLEPALQNLPIVENSRLVTSTGVAEIEFEDNSTLRIAPDSEVDFPRLERLSSGVTASSVHLVKGMAYVSLVKSPHPGDFQLLFGDQKLQLEPASHVRLQIDGNEAKLAVLDGSVHLDNPDHPLEVPKKKTVVFDLQAQAQPTIDKKIEADDFDQWDKNASEYHARTAINTAFGSSPYAYGLNDMSYYGAFSDMGGCGMMWRPYFTSAAWDPYSNGAWAYYAGAGYSWVSPYPWGWTPYHYGSWSFCPGAGWGWMPGGAWNGLNNTALLLNQPGSGGGGVLRRIPGVPIAAPAANEPSLRAVNLKPIAVSTSVSGEAFVFRKDSAGLGIPRDGLGRLDKFSAGAEKHGAVVTPIYVASPVAGNVSPRSAFAASTSGGAQIHRGSAAGSFGGQESMGGRGNAGSGGVRGGGSFGGGSSMGASRPSAPSAPSAPSGGSHH